MNISKKAGMATAVLAVAALAAPASAADLGGGYGKRSIKDAPPPPMMDHGYSRHARGPAGPCYFRGDLGYSVSKDPTVKWPVTQQAGSFDSARLNADATAGGYTAGTYNAATNTYTPSGTEPVGFDANAYYSVINSYLGDSVTGTSMENAFFGGAGIGCGMGSRGLRGEFMLGYTGHRKIDGQPIIWQGNAPPTVNVLPTPTVNDDPLHTGVKSYTAMVNAYYDFGNWGGITPYLGAGVGMAYNKMSEVWFTDNVNLPNRIEGASRASLAWSLMAGIGWQVSDRAILDFGYRYMDYGKANSGRVDSAGYVNPMVRVEDLTAHEFKVGLRYHFGGSDCCSQPVPMK